MREPPLYGGCHCGAVRYSVSEPPLSVQHCHCSQCRKLFAALCAQGAVIPKAALQFQDTQALQDYESSPGFIYSFCKVCSSILTARSTNDPDRIYFSPATLDDGVHPGHPPDKEAHTFVGSRAKWDHFNDHLPRFDEGSPDEILTEMMITDRNR